MGKVGTPLDGHELLEKGRYTEALDAFNHVVRGWGTGFKPEEMSGNDERYETLFGLYRAAMMSRDDKSRVIQPVINTMRLEAILEKHPAYRQRVAKMVKRDTEGRSPERKRRLR